MTVTLEPRILSTSPSEKLAMRSEARRCIRRRDRPSVRNVSRTGTWSDKPSRLGACAPLACSRAPSRPARADATSSGEGEPVAKPGVAARQVVNPTGEFAYGAGPGVSAQGQIHGVSGAEIDEVCRGEDGPRAVLANPGRIGESTEAACWPMF